MITTQSVYNYNIITEKKTDKTASFVSKNKQLPFPELFDRSERTYCVTFGLAGDLSYVTPVQRIASNMDFTARLKRRHLMDLI